MEVFIARDGVMIGEYLRTDLEKIARAGKVQPTDHYWHSGMTDWLLLAELLGDATWLPVESPPPAEMKTANPDGARRFLAPAVAAVGFVLAGGLLIHFTSSDSADEWEAAGSHPMPGAMTTPAGRPTESETRDKAASELRRKVDNLPSHPAPPLHVFYYDVDAQMSKTLSTRAPWNVVLRGGENLVEPGTDQTIQRTEFELTADYEEGEWTYTSYRAVSTNLADFSTTQRVEGEETLTPPSIVGLLGLKTKER